MLSYDTRRRSAYALTDLLTTVLMLAILAAIAAASLAESRRASSLGESIANLKRFNHGTESHAADFDGSLWGFTWQASQTVQYLDESGDLVVITLPDSDLEAAAYQAIHLIRLLDDRVGDHPVTLPSGWIPHALYSHLPLIEYLGVHPLDRWTVDPGDTVRTNWKDDPINKFDYGLWLPLQPDPANPDSLRWPYSSSYVATPATWDQEQSDLDSGTGMRVEQGGSHNFYITPSEPSLGPANLADVSFPSRKVYVHDQFQRHFGPCSIFFGIKTARLPLAFLDGSVSVRHTADSNPGWSPNAPTLPCDLFTYSPSRWEPPICKELTPVAAGRYHWTRAGMKGLDFGAKPLDTGQSDQDCLF